MIVRNRYDELGQLIGKGTGGKTTQTALQDVDYTYNIRGWLKTINDVNNIGTIDLFAFKLGYNEGTTPLYNGNISLTQWKTRNTDSSLKTYNYTYDALNRITSAINTNANYNLDLVNYDKNGNIMALKRKGHTNATATTFGMMDDLTYNYDAGNKLTKVEDIASLEGFKNGANIAIEYTYDQNGNMLSDANKGITGIVYNHLNLPTTVTFVGTNKKIDYFYDAVGTKLKKVVTDASSLITTEYAGNYVYENSTLQFFNTAEGYVEPNGTGWQYVYQYKDHLGNVRLSYADSNGDGVITATGTGAEIREENNFYPFGLKHKGYNNVVNGVENPYKYNNKELEEDLQLGWYDYGARRYDPTIARWTTQDPLADLYESWSPYNYTLNNPIRYIDPDGTMVSDAITGNDVVSDTDPDPDIAPIILDEVVVVGEKKKSSNWLNWVQTGLDVVGFIPVVGEVADALNAVIFLAQGDYINAGISAIAIIPIIGDAGKIVRLGAKLDNFIDSVNGISGVYEITTKSGKKYIGQSKDIGKRLKQHNKSGKFGSDPIADVKVTEVKGTDRVDREVFEQRKLNDAGGIDNTLNERNPIGPARAKEMSRNVSTGKKFEMN